MNDSLTLTIKSRIELGISEIMKKTAVNSEIKFENLKLIFLPSGDSSMRSIVGVSPIILTQFISRSRSFSAM